MIFPRTLASWLLGCVACLFLGHGSSTVAQTRQFSLPGRKISYSSTFEWTSVGGTHVYVVPVPLFDPALGQLESVHLEKEVWSTAFVQTTNHYFFPVTATIHHTSQITLAGATMEFVTSLTHTESILVQIPANDGQAGGADRVGWISRSHGYLSEVFSTPTALNRFKGTAPALLNVTLNDTAGAYTIPSGFQLPTTFIYPVWGLPIGRIRVTYEYQ